MWRGISLISLFLLLGVISLLLAMTQEIVRQLMDSRVFVELQPGNWTIDRLVRLLVIILSISTAGGILGAAVAVYSARRFSSLVLGFFVGSLIGVLAVAQLFAKPDWHVIAAGSVLVVVIGGIVRYNMREASPKQLTQLTDDDGYYDGGRLKSASEQIAKKDPPRSPLNAS